MLMIGAIGVCAASGVDVAFDSKTGAWTGLSAGGRNLISTTGPDAYVSWSDGKLPAFGNWKLVSMEKHGQTTVIVRSAGDWLIRTETTLNGNEVRRRASFKWNGSKPARVDGTSLRVPGVRMSQSPSDYYVIPGNFPITRHGFDSLKADHTTDEGNWLTGEYAIAAVHSQASDTSLIAGYSFEIDEASVCVDENKDSVTIRHDFWTGAILKPGEEIDCGTQIIRVVRGNENRMLSAIGKLSDEIGNGPAANRPADLAKCVLYEAHPWGRLESWHDQDRGNRYPRLTALLPYYKALGVTRLWLLPVSWPPPWVYTLPAFDRIDPGNGTPEELKALVDKAHETGIRTMIDLVVYGIKPDSEEVAKLPDDCWCYDENGRRVRVWGGMILAADCSSKSWQAKIAHVAEHWAKDFGFDGTRLDCTGWGQTHNWKNPMRASASIAYGGSQLNGVIRKAMQAANPEAVELPEGSKPILFRNADLVFGYPLHSQMRSMTLTPDLPRWISHIQEWLEFERHCYPSKALPGIVRFLENHDTVSAAEYFGVGPSQALMAIDVFIQGTPLIYQEEETGFSRDLSAWLKLRNTESCFFNGDASYTSVQSSNPNVFCCLRKCKSGAAVVAVNMTGTAITSRLSWPKTIGSEFPDVYDAFSGKTQACAGSKTEVRIPAYRPIVLLLKPHGGRPMLKSQDVVNSADRLKATPVNASSPIHIENVKRWFVQTSEGYLEDDFNPLAVKLQSGESAVDALPVLRRAWDPLTSGLLDGTSKCSIGVISANGQVTRVEFDPRTADTAKILDQAADGKSVDLSVTPHVGRQDLSDKESVAKWMEITPQFVNLKTGGRVLSLARRHGGLPVAWTKGGLSSDSLISCSDAYTDSGIYPNKHYASADGDTNPRLSVQADDDSATVTFTGKLRDRSWNGFQTCGLPKPEIGYRLSYRVDRTDTVMVTFGMTPSVDISSSDTFLALRIPFVSFGNWKAVGADQIAAGSVGRLSESRATGAKAYEITVAGKKLTVDSFERFKNVFLTDGALFLAISDGDQLDVKAGQEISGSAKISIAN